MNSPDPSLDKLFATVRVYRPDTIRFEYGFETRLLARIRAERETTSSWLLFSWRLTPFFAVITLMFGAWFLTKDDLLFSDFDSVITRHVDQEVWMPYLMEEIGS